MIVSESCIEYRSYEANDFFGNAGRLSHEISGDLNSGMSAFYDWNLLLDEAGGPNHVGNLCHASFLYDRQKKQLFPQLIRKHFYHFTHFIDPGAKRIGFSKYTDKLDVTAFHNPNGRLVVVVLKRTEKDIPVILRLNDKIIKLQISAQSISTGVIDHRLQ